MPQFLLSPEDIDVKTRLATLTGDEAAHAVKVLRKKAGDEILLFDGLGSRWRGIIEAATKSAVKIRALTPLPGGEPPAPVILLVALLKSERWEILLEKATELGATEIYPLLTGHTVSTPLKEKSQKKVARWNKRLLSAAKQCERGKIPVIHPPSEVSPLLEALLTPKEGERRIICTERIHAKELSPEPTQGKITIAIGPEGGWSKEELALFAKAAFTSYTLGPRILRSETALLAALSRVQIY